MRKLPDDQAKAAFQNDVNKAAKAIRQIVRTVKGNPSTFDAAVINQTAVYLNNQLSALQKEMLDALSAADPSVVPFTLGETYRPLTAPTIVIRNVPKPHVAIVGPPDEADDDDEEDIDMVDEDEVDDVELSDDDLAAIEATEGRDALYREAPPSGPSTEPTTADGVPRRPIGRLAGSKEVLYEDFVPVKPVSPVEEAGERPDKTGGIRDAGFLEE